MECRCISRLYCDLVGARVCEGVFWALWRLWRLWELERRGEGGFAGCFEILGGFREQGGVEATVGPLQESLSYKGLIHLPLQQCLDH